MKPQEARAAAASFSKIKCETQNHEIRDPNVVDDAESAQAQALLGELYGHVAETRHKLEAAEYRRAHAHGSSLQDPIVRVLRLELHEVHRLIAGLHRRFPECVERSRGITNELPPARSETRSFTRSATRIGAIERPTSARKPLEMYPRGTTTRGW